MASSTPATPVTRRSFSLPINRVPSTPDPQIEILFTLPSARIIAFTTPTAVSSPTSNTESSNGSPVVTSEPGSLSWVSRFETTIAVGAFRIYRAPGSVAFLNCANALRPILPKSQAWCVDGESKFVLQVRPPQYWRIEVPNKTPNEISRVHELKRVLEQVLRFEKTPCPFRRDFTVELPEMPQTPVKKRPWKPVDRPKLDELPLQEPSTTPSTFSPTMISAPSSVSSPLSGEPYIAEPLVDASITPPELPRLQVSESNIAPPSKELEENTPSSSSPKSQLLDEPSNIVTPPNVANDTTPAKIGLEPSPLGPSLVESIFGDYTAFGDDSDSFSDATEDTQLTPKSLFQPVYQAMTTEPERDSKPSSLQSSRSITAPPVLSLITSPPSKHRKSSISPLEFSTIIESDSDFSSSVDSFHSVQSWHSPLAPPSPPASRPSSPSSTYPYPHNNITLPKRAQHVRETSELTATPETPQVWDITESPTTESIQRSSSPTPQTPTLVTDAEEKSDEEKFEVLTPPTIKPLIRHRATTSSNSRRRALSPLPPAVNLFSPPRRRSRRLQTARHLPTAIIQKTYEILLSPPSHLFHLMLSIASKIAAGEWRGVLSGHGESVHWDFEDEYERDGWFEDDYGVSLPKTQGRAKSTSSSVSGGSWEVD